MEIMTKMSLRYQIVYLCNISSHIMTHSNWCSQVSYPRRFSCLCSDSGEPETSERSMFWGRGPSSVQRIHQSLWRQLDRPLHWAWGFLYQQASCHHWACASGNWTDRKGPTRQFRTGRWGYPCKIWCLLAKIQGGQHGIWISRGKIA